MAGRAVPDTTSENSPNLPEPTASRDQVREVAAKLYGQGYERKHIARMMIDHLVPIKTFEDGTPRPLEQRLSQARTKLRNWEHQQDFRDLVYRKAVVKLDLQTPAVLGGVLKKAKKGRVDAARLVLELTGRHNPKGEVQPTQIALVVNGVPRPMRESQAKAVAADAEGLVVELNGLEVQEDDDV